jgi:hypothetical protein
MSVRQNAFYLLVSLSALGTGFFIATAHPVAPRAVSIAFAGVFLLSLWQPRTALFSVPVLLPLLNFAPWTGWLVVDEFDLLVLAIVAAGYFRMRQAGFSLQRWSAYFVLLVIVALLVYRGANKVVAQDLNLFADYSTPLNSFRIGKSLLWVVLLSPLIARFGPRDSANSSTSLFFGTCLLGSIAVVLAIFWERGFYPGLLDISTPYRTVALFWEMHLGGAALDAYLVLIAPLLVWAWRAARSPISKLALGAFVLVYVYVCLTTFSRGVFVAIIGSMIILSTLLMWLRVSRRHVERAISLPGVAMLFLVALEVALLLGADSFLSKRLASSERDLGGRLQHWEQGINLLRTPGEWLFGIGLGALPARLTEGEGGLPLPGFFYPHDLAGRRTLVLAGPNASDSVQDLRGLFALSQRVDLIPGQRYRFALDVHSERSVEMLIQVCEQHLLYPARCQWQIIRLESGGWQHWQSELSGQPFRSSALGGIGHGVLLLSVLTPNTRIDLADLDLSAGQGNLLRNAQFHEGAAGWFPAERSYFLPWHIDNFYLEILIDTGFVGLLGFLVLVLSTIRRLFQSFLAGNILAPYFISCIAGLLALGLVVSVLDMPRVATLFGSFLLWAWQSSRQSFQGKPYYSG